VPSWFGIRFGKREGAPPLLASAPFVKILLWVELEDYIAETGTVIKDGICHSNMITMNPFFPLQSSLAPSLVDE
jgi:hypothetical protein